MGDAWWNATARRRNLARNSGQREALTIVLGALPEELAEGIPFEPLELWADRAIEEAGCAPVGGSSREEEGFKASGGEEVEEVVLVLFPL